MALSLTNLVRKSSDKPPRIVIYGKGGIGKTTLASEFPNPIFIQTEDGAGSLEITTFANEPFTRYGEIEEAIELLMMQDHDFKTVVIDSLTKMEPIIWAEACRRENWSNIEDPGYGKGYVVADGIWRHFLSGLDLLRAKGMTVVCLGHERVESAPNPEGEDFLRYRMRLQQRKSGEGPEPMVREWADIVGFLTEVRMVTRDDPKAKNKPAKASGGGQRTLNLQPRPAFEAKNRYDMPAQVLINPGQGYAALAPFLPGKPTATSAAKAA